jgi:orotidine-5'-phosphate decarboxylase
VGSVVNNYNNKLICAVDVKNVQHAIDLSSQIKPHVGCIKLGLEFFTINGPEGVRAIKELEVPVFLDLKFHDIPNTTAQAVRSAVNLGVDMLTIHTSGGKAMMHAAAMAAKEEALLRGVNLPIILGVTVLTSMDGSDLASIGVSRKLEEQVLSLARLSKESGLDGIVCSPLEISIIKKEFGDSLKLIVPGIRPGGTVGDDQKRVMSPARAIENGADFIVVGRPITGADSPAIAAKRICAEIADAKIL